MRMSRIFHLVSVLILIAASSSYAVSQPSFTGLITSVRLKSVAKGDKITKKFAIDLYLQIRNPSTEPLILYRSSSFIGNKKISFLSASGSVEDVSTFNWSEFQIAQNAERRARAVYRDPEDHDFFKEALYSLEKMEAPADFWFVTVAPESYFEFRDSVEIESGFDIDEVLLDKAIAKDKAKHDELMREFQPLSRRPFEKDYGLQFIKAKYPYLRIEYELSTGSFKKDPNLLRTLQTRWSKFGKMPLNGDNYYLKSDPIVISLPD